MNDAWDTSEEAQATGGMKALRDAYDKQKQKNDELAKRLEDLEATQKRVVVADLIEAQGVSRGAAQYYSGDPDPEKVVTWVNDIRTAFGGAVPQQSQPVEPVLNPTDMAQYQNMMQAGANGNTVNSNMDTLGASLNDAKTPAEMIAAFQRFGR